MALLVQAVGAATPSDTLLANLQAQQGFVHDFAHVLGPEQRDVLEQRVRELQTKSGAELAVVTIKSLEGGQIDDFANKLFNRWHIGQKGKDNGVLLLVAVDDHKARIEVGYGLEPVIPDVLAGRILSEELFPQFRNGQYFEGLNRTVQRLAAIIERGEPPSKFQTGLWTVFHPSKQPLGQQLIMTAFLSLFVMIGMFTAGGGIGAGQFPSVMFGAVFTGVPMFMACMIGGWTPIVLIPLGLILFCAGVIKGIKTPDAFSNIGTSGGYNGSGGSWGGGGGFSCGGGGGFGGGSSGGGGASGGW